MLVSGDKLRHALGVQAFRYKGGLRWSKPYRNRFFPGGDDVALFASMAALGLVRLIPDPLPGLVVSDAFYMVTDAGAAYALKGIEFKRRWGYGKPVND